MAVDSFLYFTGADQNGVSVNGESTDSVYAAKKAIEVFSWSWGASNPVSIGSSSSGHGSGKVSFGDLNIMKKVDLASPMLLLACCQGGHFPQVNLEIRKSGAAGGAAYLIFQMTEVFIASVQESASSEEGTESVSLAFGTFSMSYAQQAADGKLGTAVPAAWNLMTNVKA